MKCMLNSEKEIRISAFHCRDIPPIFHSLLLFILVTNEIPEFMGLWVWVSSLSPLNTVSYELAVISKRRGAEGAQNEWNIIHKFTFFLLFFKILSKLRFLCSSPSIRQSIIQVTSTPGSLSMFLLIAQF